LIFCSIFILLANSSHDSNVFLCSDQNAQYYRLRAKELSDKEEKGLGAPTADETDSAKMLLNMLNDASLAAEKPKPKGDGSSKGSA
jgi:hypothetical protein